MRTFLASLLLLAAAPATASAETWPCLDGGDDALDVTIVQAASRRYGRNGDLPEFGEVRDAQAYDIHLAAAVEPPRDQVRNLVLFAAGQQGWEALSPTGLSNLMTGQTTGYKALWYGRDHERNAGMHECSVYARLVRASQGGRLEGFDVRDDGDTFVGLAFDTAFYFDETDEQRETAIDAWYTGLTGHAEAANIDTIYLAGVSRGGALLHHLGQRFAEDGAYDEAKIVVGGVDVVFQHDEGEFCSDETEIDNPTLAHHEYRAWASAAGECFDFSREGLRVMQLVGGQQVLLLNDRHAYAVPLDDRRELLGFHQRWEPWKHKFWQSSLDLDGFVEDMVDPQLNFFEAALSEDADDRWRIAFGAADGLDNFTIVAREQGPERPADLILADADGDGDTDLLRLDGAGGIEKSRSYAGDSWGDWDAWAGAPAGADEASDFGVGDFDGDGTDDLVVRIDGAWSVLHGPTRGLFARWPATTTEDLTWTAADGPEGGLDEVAIGDFDGDGRDDLLHLAGSSWLLHSASGDRDDPFASSGVEVGQTTESVAWGGEPGYAGFVGWGRADVLVGDFDGDGFSDVVRPEAEAETEGVADEAPIEGTVTLTICALALEDGDPAAACGAVEAEDAFRSRYSDFDLVDRLAVGDTDGDGADDLLLLDDQRVFRLTAAADWSREEWLPPGPHSWREFMANYGIGDFDRDGTADLFFAR